MVTDQGFNPAIHAESKLRTALRSALVSAWRAAGRRVVEVGWCASRQVAHNTELHLTAFGRR